MSRLIPADELGPGAKEAGVAFFIDQQMAGSFGRAETWYMQGRWKAGTDEQGYQVKLTPAQASAPATVLQAIVGGATVVATKSKPTRSPCRRSAGN